MRSGRGDGIPVDGQHGVATVAVTVVGHSPDVVLVAVVLDRDHEIRIGEVDASHEAAALVATLVLRDRSGESMAFEDAQDVALGDAVGDRRIAVTKHLTEPRASRPSA